MYQELCHDLALAITDMSRSAADELEQKNVVYRQVMEQRNAAADALQDQLPAPLQEAWEKYRVMEQRSQFMEQELQFFKGYCSYPVLMEHFQQDTVSHQKLMQELLEKFR